MNKQDILIRWLQDAYAMENAVSKILEKHKEDFRGNVTIQKQLEEHIADSHDQAERLVSCLKDLGTEVSTADSTVASVIELLQSIPAHATGEEKLIKNSMAEYLAEQTEIAVYRKIGSLAGECEKPAIVEMCQYILVQKEEMAELVLENIL